MRIYIKADGVRLRLWFPLSILKSRIGYKIAERSIEQNAKKQLEQIPQDANESTLTREQLVEMYKILKQSVELNGHFNLVEVDSHDGEKVVIRV